MARYEIVSGILESVDTSSRKITIDVSGPGDWPEYRDFTISEEVGEDLEKMGDEILDYLGREVTLKLKDGIVVDIEFPE